MTKRFTRRFLSVLFIVWPLLSGLLPSYTDDHTNNKQIAGHRILRTLNQPKDGVSVSSPRVIFEDRAGLYWIGTYTGVSSYSDKQDKWTSFTKQTGELVADAVEQIGQSGDDNLWFVSGHTAIRPGPNLSCFAGQQWKKSDSTPKDSIFTRQISAMFPGHNGKLWFASKDELVAYDGRQWEPRIKLSQAIGNEFSIGIRTGLQDSEGYVWLGTTEGILRFDERNREWKLFNPFQKNVNSEEQTTSINYGEMMIRDGIYRSYEDRKGRIWWASAGVAGVYLVYDKNLGSWTQYKLRDHLQSVSSAANKIGLSVIYQDKNGTMMFGTSIGLITFTEGDKQWKLLTPENSSLPHASISAISEDRAGRIWIGTGAGIIVLEP